MNTSLFDSFSIIFTENDLNKKKIGITPSRPNDCQWPRLNWILKCDSLINNSMEKFYDFCFYILNGWTLKLFEVHQSRNIFKLKYCEKKNQKLLSMTARNPKYVKMKNKPELSTEKEANYGY